MSLGDLKAKAAREDRMVKGLFMSDAECHLRARAHAEASRAGVVNCHEVRAHADAVVASLASVIGETNLTGREALDLRAEMVRAPLSAEASAARHDDFVQDMRTPIYGTTHVVSTKARAAKAAAHSSPALRRALNQGNAANSVALGRAMYRRQQDGEPILRNPINHGK